MLVIKESVVSRCIRSLSVARRDGCGLYAAGVIWIKARAAVSRRVWSCLMSYVGAACSDRWQELPHSWYCIHAVCLSVFKSRIPVSPYKDCSETSKRLQHIRLHRYTRHSDRSCRPSVSAVENVCQYFCKISIRQLIFTSFAIG